MYNACIHLRNTFFFLHKLKLSDRRNYQNKICLCTSLSRYQLASIWGIMRDLCTRISTHWLFRFFLYLSFPNGHFFFCLFLFPWFLDTRRIKHSIFKEYTRIIIIVILLELILSALAVHCGCFYSPV